MTWEDALELGPTRLAQILGCPITTAHSWIRRSGPPDWQKPHFLRTIKKAEQGAEVNRRERGKSKSNR